MTQQLFDDVIGTPPPSTVDVHALVRRERRARVVRRAGYGMTAVVALAVVTTAMVSVSGSPSSPHTPPAAQSQPTQDTRFQLLANDKESADASAKRLSQTLDQALKQAAPTAKWVNIKTSDAGNPTADGLPYIRPIFNDPNEPAPYFSGVVNLENDARQGSLTLMIHPRADPKKYPKAPEVSRLRLLACAGEAGCTESTGPNGEKTVVIEAEKGNIKFQEIRVNVADNRVLTIIVGMNVNPKDVKTLPLTVTQTTAIAVYVTSQIKP